MYIISLCIYADSRMIGPPRTPALGYEFLNKKLIRGSRRIDAVAAKSDAVTAWKCTATDAYLRLQTLTDAYWRWFPVRGFCSFRVWPCQSVPQCDWAFRFSMLPNSLLIRLSGVTVVRTIIHSLHRRPTCIYINPKSAEISVYDSRDQRVFSFWNHHKCLSWFFRFIWIPICNGRTVIINILLIMPIDILLISAKPSAGFALKGLN